MRYGSLEFAYAQPFADALVSNHDFRSWVVKRTKFAAKADHVRLLHEEMLAARSPVVGTWWRSHFTEACRCLGCSGQETDLLAIFEHNDDGSRFAIHCEVKQPTDRFPASKDQARNYLERAQCWAKAALEAVLPHSDADTLLLCSSMKLVEYAPHLPKFGGVITFEEIRSMFPHATAV